tara:strand:- start:607 stop:807 length:201 start_codon:yes stop_codon:yes gene_type:complete
MVVLTRWGAKKRMASRGNFNSLEERKPRESDDEEVSYSPQRVLAVDFRCLRVALLILVAEKSTADH